MTGPVLFCFDGSDGSAAALIHGGTLFAPQTAIVLTVWETVTSELLSTGAGALGYVPDETTLDQRNQEVALDAARRGVLEAEARGWEATRGSNGRRSPYGRP